MGILFMMVIAAVLVSVYIANKNKNADESVVQYYIRKVKEKFSKQQ